MAATTNPSSVPTYEADHWISVRNWNRDVAFRAPGPTSERDVAGAAAYRTSPPASTADTRTLAVTATYDIAQQHGAIIDVSPDTGSPTVAHPGDTYSFVARNAAGAVVATAGALGSLGHVDFGSPEIVIVGKIPAAGVREIDLLQNGAVIATDHASAHAPTASASSPSRGQRVGGAHGAVLRWRSHDADGGSLTVTVDYSSKGGRAWTTIYTGPDTGSVSLPSRLLSASKNARLREYVSDGFNEAIVTSPRFVAVGAPPAVAITAPHRDAHVSAGGALDLAGTAYDDSGDRLTGRALTWRVGRQVIGRGTNAVTVALPGGRYDLTLTARDRRGRTATASVRVSVMPSPPVISLLRAPRRVSRRAHSFTLRIASLAPATLTIGRKRVLVGRAVHKVRVKVVPGRKALTFVLMLRSGRFTTAIPIRVVR